MRTPQRFGRYELVERIGVGGMAEVFRARALGAEGFERSVAIKRILPHLTSDHEFVRMFIDEAKIAAQLGHPNIVAVHDLGRVDGSIYIAMEYVAGRDLRDVCDAEVETGGATPVGVSCGVVMKMCEALHHAHFALDASGRPLSVVHRDVSPQNVLVSWDGEVKVADFGLAKARGRLVTTDDGVVKGKLAYLAPEQLRGDAIDHRVDIFGLGIVLFELLTGSRLFLGPSDMETLRRVHRAEVPSICELRPEVPTELEDIVRHALSRDPESRPRTALELHDAIQAVVYGRGYDPGGTAVRAYLHTLFAGRPSSGRGAPEWAVEEEETTTRISVEDLPPELRES